MKDEGPDGREDIRYDSQATFHLCRYLNTILQGSRYVGLFTLARHAGLSYEEALEATSKLVSVSPTAIRRRIVDIQNIKVLFEVAGFTTRTDQIFFEDDFVEKLIPWLCNLYGMHPEIPHDGDVVP